MTAAAQPVTSPGTVLVELPEEIWLDAGLTARGRSRGAGEVAVIAIEGVAVVANLVDVGELMAKLPGLAATVRGWVFRQPQGERRLRVETAELSVEVPLPPNVSTADILEALRALVGPDGED